MHDTARETGRAFFEVYAAGITDGVVLDVGSMDVNGTLRPFVPPVLSYCGCDLEPGPNVTVVLDDPYRMPFAHDEFDLVVSTSCMEHDEFFWLSFAEMARVVKPGGYVYLSAPTGGAVHRHPIDAWRFYPDAGRALASWARREGHQIWLIESFIRPPGAENWSDFVAVFGKRDDHGVITRPGFIGDRFPDAEHRQP